MRLVTAALGGVWLAGLLGILGLPNGWRALGARESSEKIGVKLPKSSEFTFGDAMYHRERVAQLINL